ncbi:MAG: response regulator [Treponema sp.]|nr:response regulator [Treponema sp.]
MGEGSKKRILAVDDMPLTLTAIRNILQKDFDIRLTKSPKTAFSILNTVDIDLILLDIEMPEISGFEFLEQLRTNPDYAAYKTIPVIFITSHETDAIVNRMLSSGAAGYVTKPVTAGNLLERIASVFAVSPDAEQPAGSP